MTFPSGDIVLNTEVSGPKIGAPVVLLHCMGGDLRVWDKVLPLLPETNHVIRVDLRGHGLSSCPPAPYSMGGMIRDVEQVLERLRVRDAVVVGIGLGGMIAQGLAVKRLDQVRGLVLCNTAAKMGHPPHWQAMIEDIKAGRQDDLAQRFMQIWFHRAARAEGLHHDIQKTFQSTAADALMGAFQALMGSDFYTPTSGLRLQSLGISGAEDRFVPPDLMRETIDLIPGSEFALLHKSGHLPPVDQPDAFAKTLTGFLKRIGHV
ncbi:alpha/beta fold hydrolase [Cognatishimia maritima]|uniref:3-oxoadipate enol-lactonase n=1 Tax=Cognatishimia maritima TaxID=870908 RepID=A0A1M5KDN8_9RHOB|nr:alpha/beta fold hydrolase [Cognatishimia maritima]SHG50815.1 3-oxoadipate enol-lactonase [Cognatishimia maritima]